ncbi:hypothetical protein MR813_01675, partial [bacterium]|nr:hypothetical protein [bacterium]
MYWKVGRENKRKQTGTLRHIGLIISDLQKKNRRFQQRLKLCSSIVFMSDYQCVRCSASEKEPVTQRTIKKDIADLQSKGILSREGGRKNGRWVITNKNDNKNRE